jgi:hypothetical protein
MGARLVSRLVSFVIAGALVLSLAVPARAQIDPMTLSLIISGAQLLMGVVSTVVVGAAYESGKSRGPVPLGTPCGMIEGVPQICWTQPGGGYEGTDVLPYSAPSPVAPRVPGLSLDLILQEAPQPARSPAPAAGQ